MDDLMKSEIDRITGKKEVPKRVKNTKSAFQIAAEKFLEDDLTSVQEDVKKTIKKRGMSFAGDILNFIVDRIFHSSSYSRGYSSSSVVRTYEDPSYRTNYSNISKSASASKSAPRFDFSELVWPNRSGAQWLLDQLIEEIETSSKHRVSVMKMYDILDDTSNLEMNDDDFGWYDLSPGSGACIREVHNGYRLFLPPVKEFND